MAKTLKLNLTPKLRFGVSTEAWSLALLDEVATRGSGHTPSKSYPEYYEGTIPWVSLADSDKLDAGLISETKYTISQEGIRKSSAVLHSKGTVLLSRDAGVGKSAVMGLDMAVSQHFITWKCSDQLNNWYLYYYLQTQKRELERISVGSTIKTIGLPYFKKLRVPLPPRTEQDKIADFLVSADALLNNLRAQKQSLESYKKGIMQKLFTQEIRFKDATCKNYPDWRTGKLGDVFSAVKGSGISKEELANGGKNPCILYGELFTTYREVVSDLKSRTNVTSGTRSKVGDLLVPCSTTTTAIDLANVTALNQENVLLGGDITVLRSRDALSNVFYAYYLTNYKKRELAKFGQGVTIIHVYYNHFKEMIIDIPSVQEQEKIADFIVSLDNLIEAKSRQVAKTEQWKKGLIQKMFI